MVLLLEPREEGQCYSAKQTQRQNYCIIRESIEYITPFTVMSNNIKYINI